MILLGLEVVTVGGIVSACSYLWARIVMDLADEEADRWLSVASERTRAEALILKSEFQGAEVAPKRVMDNHTHGDSAAARSTASFFIQRVASGIGRTPYYYQGSGSDQRSGRSYSRKYYWAKDLMAPATNLEPARSDILSMVDVDYYVDMEEMLMDRFQPYMLYTLVPSRAGKDAGDYGYRFMSSGKVEYHVSGGGRYNHELWNWDGDSVRVFRYLFGVPIGMACYAIERRQMDDDHQVVLLVPLYRTVNPFMTWIATGRLQARPLRRFNPVVDGFVRFYVSKPGGLEVVTGVTGEYSSSSVPAHVDSTIASVANTISGKLTLSTVKAKLDDGRPTDIKNHRGAEVLLEFHLKRKPTIEQVSIVDTVRRFQWVPKGAEPDTDAKPGMTAFMQPLLDGGFTPDVCEGNEKRFVDKRIKEIASKELHMDSFMLKCMDEFAAFVVPDPEMYSLNPVDVDEVYARQSKPSQQAILREAEHGTPIPVTQQFMKREAYGRVNDPRGISTINGVDKREYSRFIYAFTDTFMKRQKWYAFGKSPKEVAERVAEISEKAHKLFKTDFSRMDGRHSNVLTFLEKLVLLRAFHPSHHTHFLETFNRHNHLRARTKFGISYETMFQRLSGGADTSSSNTLDTAFIAYLTYRMMTMEPKEAWELLGIYGGDDGLSADMDPQVATRAAVRVGQVLDLEGVNRGELGVAFLARRYGPDVWYGDTNSCCDIKRQLSKFHLTVNLPSKVTPVRKLQEKSLAFAFTDANTPIIGEFVSKVLELHPHPKSEFKNELGIWGVEMDAERQYPNSKAEWMEDIVSAELPDFNVALFREWLAQSDGGTILSAPRFADPLPVDPQPGVVSVDGDLIVTANDRPGTGGQEARTESRPNGKANFRPRQPKTERPTHKVRQPNVGSQKSTLRQRRNVVERLPRLIPETYEEYKARTRPRTVGVIRPTAPPAP